MLKRLLFAFAVLASITTYAQDDPIVTDAPLSTETPESPYPWEFGLKLGGSALAGDLTDNSFPSFDQISPAGAVFLRRRLGKVFALRLELMYGILQNNTDKAEETAIQALDAQIETSVLEPSLSLEIEPFFTGRFSDDFTFRPGISPYLTAGIGYGLWGDSPVEYGANSNVDPADPQLATDRAQREDETGGVVYPIGAGIKYYFSPKSSLGIEYNVRLSGSDIIDGVSEVFGDTNEGDKYNFIGLTYSAGFGARDADGDGITDENDECPTEPGTEATNGCPDTDGDGVADKDDRCPNEPGVANLAGCPDGDSDGVADRDDECPTEPGTAATNGCPDGDGDGIADKDDECPDEAGLASLNGCPDGDGDGIADKDDECPAEAGPASTNGCPDRDGDGIADKDDECPDEAGVAERNGCPLPNNRPENLSERVQRYRELLEGQDFQYIMVDTINGTIAIDRIYFPTDVSSLNRPDRLIIEEIDRFLELPGASDFTIRYEGHADRRASDEYNQGLSERRAQSASDYSERQGANAANLSAIGFGEKQPVGATLRENRVVIPVATEPTRMIDLRN